MSRKTKTPLVFPIEQKDGSFEILELYGDDLWQELADIFGRQNTRRPMSFLPPELQIQALYYLACRKREIPAAAGGVYALSGALALIDLLKIDTLLTTPELLPDLVRAYEKYADKKFPCSTVICISDAVDTGEKLAQCVPNAAISIVKNPLHS